MSTKSGTCHGHKFHGNPKRFEVVAEFVLETFGRNIHFEGPKNIGLVTWSG